MCKINVFKLNNRGSATVEISMVIPVVIGIVFMVVALFIHNVWDGAVQGEIVSELYLYSVNDDERKLEENIYSNLQGVLAGNNNISLTMGAQKGMALVNVSGMCGSGLLEYNLSDKTYRTEIDLCTSRLRRWQLYGDVLSD